MNRVLLVDDNSKFERETVEPLRAQICALAQSLYGDGGDVGIIAEPAYAPDILWLDAKRTDADALVTEVKGLASQPWDVFAIDINLDEERQKGEQDLRLPIQLLAAFRDLNKTAIAFLYSGAITDYLKKLFTFDTAKESHVNETLVRELFALQITGFVKRPHLNDRIVNAMQRPPFALRVEKEMLRTPNAKVEADAGSGPLGGKTFRELAEHVRLEDNNGRLVVSRLVEHGVAALVDLYA